MKAAPKALTVSELTREVRHLLEVSFMQVWVEGEIGNFARPGSGHWYFSLKDSKAQVRCAMFRNRNQRLSTTPSEGDQILIRGKVSLYESRGDFQIIVEDIQPAGLGELQRAYEKLKARLEQEGLFANERKRALPALPERIGVVTSPTGAAIHDILTVLKRRFPAIPITLYPCSVQGKAATQDIVRAIERANRDQRCDVLIVGRGGGSLEDLWCFNEEAVARAISTSAIPVVSAVGHEVDVTIADLVADLRAPTPSAAAEKLTPNRQDWLDQISRLEERLIVTLRRQLRELQIRTDQFKARLKDPQQELQTLGQRLDELDRRLQQSAQRQLTQHREQLLQIGQRLQRQRPDRLFAEAALQLGRQHHALHLGVQHHLERLQHRFQTTAGQLHIVSPLATLERGYAIVEDDQSRIVRRADQVQPGETIHARVASGRLTAQVNAVDS